MIKAQMVQHSCGTSTHIPPLITLSLVYPRFIHAEFMTHRVFSRNASSSRAVPIKKMIDLVESHAAAPIEYGSNQPGMQAGALLDGEALSNAQDIWHAAAASAVKHARKMADAGVHKQIVNRIMEPFSHINTIVTATDWDNFFKLRISPMAQPEIRELAVKMKAAIDASTPVTRARGAWHLPYITDEEREMLAVDNGGGYTAALISAARCARVSYMTHDGLEPDMMKDLALARRLASDQHASPFEHQGQPLYSHKDGEPGQCRNFTGWLQFRGLLKI